VQLLDSGNVVVKEMNENDSGKYLWQSFDYPTDTLLPDMKLGWELDTGFDPALNVVEELGGPFNGRLLIQARFPWIPRNFLVEQTRSRISKRALERDKVQRGTRNGAFKLSQL
jgi:hypothetical protein